MKLPPIVTVPGILSPARCKDLIALFERGDSTPGGVCRTVNGVARNVDNPNTKIRRDLKIPPAEMGTLLLNRCRREALKSHGVKIAHMDRVILSRYDVDGFFAPHRDNNASHVAFRELAVSINLNVGDYEGGYLRFPEYGPNVIASPPTGGALIFSASVLHEVMPVTAGSRYVLLTFFHSEAKERLRVQALQKYAQERLCA